jgi:RNA polymerase sigma-70 factor (ECF subfamily)
MFDGVEQPANDPDIVEASLRTFMRLPALQRSTVILMDVLGYRLHEIVSIMNVSLPAVKSNLHRGRMRLRQFAREPEDRQPIALAIEEQLRLQRYVEHFNAGNFDVLRDMLAEDVQLELVDTERRSGRRSVSGYFTNYAAKRDWKLSRGIVDGRAAIIVSGAGDLSRTPLYFILIDWSQGAIVNIRDFRYARYAIEGAEISFL